MKRLIPLLILIITIGGYLWWSASDKVDSTGKVHVGLYDGATTTWDPQMEILPFDRAPSTQLTLRWQPPQEKYNHFLITISTPDGTVLRKESGEHDRKSLDPDGLEPGKTYLFDLQACLDPSCEKWLIAQDEYKGTTAEEEKTEELIKK